jgi:hypothetical protein
MSGTVVSGNVLGGKGIYSFTGGSDGGNPNGDLVSLKSGLYGTTNAGGRGYGTVFWLAPQTVDTGPWTERTLHEFAGGNFGDGEHPSGGLLPFQGALFGTTQFGGTGTSDLGTVFVIKP